MAIGTGSLKELREKRKMELASTEYANSNKILQDQTAEEQGFIQAMGPTMVC